MPQLVTFAGRPVKLRRRVPGGLLVIFYAPQPGAPGRRRFVSEAEWLRLGRVEFFAPDRFPDVRALAARAPDVS